MKQRRIPAADGAPFAAVTLPQVRGGAVIRAENVRGRRRTSSEGFAQAVTAAQSLERQLAESLRTGAFSPGVSARDLEALVTQAVEEGRSEGLASGHAEGYAAGERAGYEAGLAAGRERTEAAVQQLGAVLEALQQPLREQHEALRSVLLDAVERIARAVVRAETLQQPGRIAQVVDETLAALPAGARNIRVFVSPTDRELLSGLDDAAEALMLLVDPSLGPGDCRVESDDSLVDFTQSARFAEILAQFLGQSGG